MSFVINPFAFSTTSGGSGTLYDAIMDDNPDFYYRLNEASGTNADNSAGGLDGTYSGVTLNQPPLYSGGGASIRLNNGTQHVEVPSTYPTSTGAITLMCVIKPNTVTGIKSIITKDQGSGGRSFQWRTNGSSLEFLKVIGGTSMVSKTAAITVGVTCMLHVTISAAGAVTLYINGAAVQTGSFPPTNFVSSNPIRIGYAAGIGVGNDAFISDVAGFRAALSTVRCLAHAQAAGFA